MHAIRRQAHRAASAPGEGTSNYNPFESHRRRHGTFDIENQCRPQITALPEEKEDVQGRISSKNEVPGPSGTPGICISHPVKTGDLCSDSTIVGSSRHSPQPGREKGLRYKILGIFWRRQGRLIQVDTVGSDDSRHYVQRTVRFQLRTLLAYNYIATALLPCIPAGFVAYYLHANAVAVFCINFAAIIPAATALSAALNDLSARAGEKVSALLNQTFGNAVQLILSVLLLKSRQVVVLKMSLLGTILSSLLLTTGLSFLLGGLNRVEQHFNVTIAQTISMLLLLAVASLIIPSTAHLMTDTTAEGILAQSRGIAVVILLSYVLWLVFTLHTHRNMFDAESPKAESRRLPELVKGAAARGIAMTGACTAASSGGGVSSKSLFKDSKENDFDSDGSDIETCSFSLIVGIIILVLSVVLVAFNTQFATDSIQSILQRRKLSQTFLSLIILPLLSNDPMAINMAIKDKMDLSISLALERCMQTCLLLVPLTVLLAWCMGVDDMNLEFDGFSIAALFASIIIVTYVVQEGKSNWLTGALLIKVFIIISLAAFYI